MMHGRHGKFDQTFSAVKTQVTILLIFIQFIFGLLKWENYMHFLHKAYFPVIEVCFEKNLCG